jgi:FkbM family methyltransferase
MLKGPRRRRLRGRLVRRVGTGRIRRGAASSMRIDATGSNPAYLLGMAEPEVQKLLQRHLRPGMVMYDVGANVGFFSLIGSRLVGSAGQVVAFEPLQENVKALTRNLELNGIDNVSIVELALGARRDRIGMRIPDTADAGTHASLGGDGPVVEVAPLDELELPAPDLIKIDIEGAEVDAVRGMRRTLGEAAPTLIVEVHDEAGTSDRWDALSELLGGLGYRIERLRDEGMAHMVATANETPAIAR